MQTAHFKSVKYDRKLYKVVLLWKQPYMLWLSDKFDTVSQLSAFELKGNVGSQTCLLEFALTVTLAEIIINLLWFTTNFPFIYQINRAAENSSALSSDDGFRGSRAAWWPGLSCNLKGHRICVRPKCPWARCRTPTCTEKIPLLWFQWWLDDGIISILFVEQH